MCRNWHVCVGRGASVSAAELLCRPPRGCVGRRRVSPNYLATTTSSKCAIFDELQEKIRSIASRPAQKVTGKSSEQSIKSVSQAACACVGQKFPTPSPPPSLPPTFSPTPPSGTDQHGVLHFLTAHLASGGRASLRGLRGSEEKTNLGLT